MLGAVILSDDRVGYGPSGRLPGHSGHVRTTLEGAGHIGRVTWSWWREAEVSHGVFQAKEMLLICIKSTKYMNTTCSQNSLTGNAGTDAVLGRHSDVVLTGTPQARDKACEVG